MKTTRTHLSLLITLALLGVSVQGFGQTLYAPGGSVGNSNNGHVGISAYSPQLILQRNTNVGGFVQGIQTKLEDGTDNWYFGALHTDEWRVSKGGYQNAKLIVQSNGDVSATGTVSASSFKVSAYSPQLVLQRNTNVGGFVQGIQTKLEDGTDNWYFGALHTGEWRVSKGDYQDAKLVVRSNGQVGIGTTTLDPADKLTVNGKIKAEEIEVVVDVPADYVFEENYGLKSLEEVETYIEKEGHLPNIPSAQEVIENGWQIGEMSNKLLEKIEELTLYLIEMKRENKALAERVAELEVSK